MLELPVGCHWTPAVGQTALPNSPADSALPRMVCFFNPVVKLDFGVGVTTEENVRNDRKKPPERPRVPDVRRLRFGQPWFLIVNTWRRIWGPVCRPSKVSARSIEEWWTTDKACDREKRISEPEPIGPFDRETGWAVCLVSRRISAKHSRHLEPHRRVLFPNGWPNTYLAEHVIVVRMLQQSASCQSRPCRSHS